MAAMSTASQARQSRPRTGRRRAWVVGAGVGVVELPGAAGAVEPRIAVWRALKRLGVVQLGDGLVALPADARTREQLEWVAVQVDEAGGTSSVWLAQPDQSGGGAGAGGADGRRPGGRV